MYRKKPFCKSGRERLTADVLVRGVTTVVDAITRPGLHDTHLVLALPLPGQAMVPGAVSLVRPDCAVLGAITEFPSITALRASRTPDFLVWTCCQSL